MIKKIDKYILKVYLSPFLLIFSVLFFLLISIFLWTELEKIIGKGLDFWTIAKLLFLLGATVVQIALPITILWSSIMALGNMGENYELSALKASGIPLHRVISPLFILTIFMSIGLYFFLDHVMPSTQKKARNMLFEIATKKPTLNFREGVFISGIPGFKIKVGNIYGDNNQFLGDIFIHKNANNFENNNTIIAKNGIFEPAEDPRYLKLQLFNGYVYENQFSEMDYSQKIKQKNQSVKFDTLIQYFDISELMRNDKFEITNYYKFYNNKKLKTVIDSMKNTYQKEDSFFVANINQNFVQINKTKKIQNKLKKWQPIGLNKINKEQKGFLYNRVKQKIEDRKRNNERRIDYLKERNKELNRIIFHLNTNYSFPTICLIFFLIGSSLGAIIRKGGLAVPVIVSTVVFMIFWTCNLAGENLSLVGKLNPTFGAWLGVSVIGPLSLFFTYKAVTDSEMFNIDNYLNPIRNLIAKFDKNKEHERYQ